MSENRASDTVMIICSVDNAAMLEETIQLTETTKGSLGTLLQNGSDCSALYNATDEYDIVCGFGTYMAMSNTKQYLLNIRDIKSHVGNYRCDLLHHSVRSGDFSLTVDSECLFVLSFRYGLIVSVCLLGLPATG